MATENATSITELDPSRPSSVEVVGEIDDHMNMVKLVLSNTFVDQAGDAWDDLGFLTVGPRALSNTAGAFTFDGTLAHIENPIGTPRLTVIATGEVGIGTETPAAPLDVVGDGIFSGNLLVDNLDTGGVIKAADGAGSALLPHFAFNPDTNMGMYRIAADVLGFSTAGVERLRVSQVGDINLDGNLGIGVSVFSGTTELTILENKSIRWKTSTGAAERGSIVVNNSENMVFNLSDPVNEKMRITGAGDMGIGVTVPLARLHIQTGAVAATPDVIADEFLIEGTGDVGMTILNASSGKSTIAFGNAGVGGQLDYQIQFRHESAAALPRSLGFLGSGGIEHVTFESGGNVGIGTSAPAADLDVRGSIIVSPDDARGATGELQVDTGTAAGELNLYTGEGTPVLRTHIGAVDDTFFGIGLGTTFGIGTAVPPVRFSVQLGGNGLYMQVGGDDTGDIVGRGLRFTSSTSGSVGAKHVIDANSANGVLALATVGVERLNITNTGNIGIGTAAPDQLLHIEAIAGDVRLKLENTGITRSAEFGIDANGLFLQTLEADGDIRFFTGAATLAMTITELGRVGIGTANPGGFFEVNAGGAVNLQVSAGAFPSQLRIGGAKMSWIDGTQNENVRLALLGFSQEWEFSVNDSVGSPFRIVDATNGFITNFEIDPGHDTQVSVQSQVLRIHEQSASVPVFIVMQHAAAEWNMAVEAPGNAFAIQDGGGFVNFRIEDGHASIFTIDSSLATFEGTGASVSWDMISTARQWRTAVNSVGSWSLQDGGAAFANRFQINTSGEIFMFLPTSAGTTGSLFSNGGVVTVSP